LLIDGFVEGEKMELFTREETDPDHG